MKNTKLFSALICGSILLAGCSFTGTEGTFEKDIQEKYNNSTADVKISNHSAALKMATSGFSGFNAEDVDDDGKTDKYEATIKMSDSLKDLDGFEMLKLEGTDPSQLATTSTYAGVTFAFDETDPTNKTVKVSVAGEDKPKNYILQINGTKAKSVSGKMLDYDGDGIWGEEEDTYWVKTDETDISSQVIHPKDMIWKGRFAFSSSYNSTENKLTFTLSSSIPENLKSNFDSWYKAEYYDAASDKWVALSVESKTETVMTGICSYTIELSDIKSGYYRVVSENLVGKTLTNDGISIPYTKNAALKYDRYLYQTSVTKLDSSITYDESLETLRSYFSTTYNKGYVDIKPSYTKTFSYYGKENKYYYASKFVKFSGVSKDTVKVYSTKAGNGDYSYNEVEVKEVTVLDDKTIRIILADSEKTLSSDYPIVVTPKVIAEYEGKIDSEDATFEISLGHLCPATKKLTKGGNSIINQN